MVPPSPGGPPPLPPPPISPWWSDLKCAAGFEPDLEANGCVPCDAGEQGQIEEATGRQVCNMCPESTMQPHMGKVECVDCDDTGLNCDYKDKIEVNRKYWRPVDQDLNHSLQLTNPVPERSQPIQAVLCPWPDACLGGNVSGDVSCAPGHSGLMCGFCEPGFYRGSSICVACPSTLGSFGQAVSAAWIAGLVVFLLGIAAFLKLGANKDSPTGGPQTTGLALKFPRVARYLARMPPRWRQQVAAIGKIVLAFTQCLAPLTQFTMVRWPKTFTTFIERLDIGQQTADAVRLDSVIPAECLFGRRLGFYYEMVATLLLPLISFALILLVALVVYAIEHRSSKKEYAAAKAKHERFVRKNLNRFTTTSEKKHFEKEHAGPKEPLHWCASIKKKLNRPQVWTLNIWAWMVLFPVVTRKMVKMMPGQCREICSNEGECLRYLKDDPGIVCYEGMYWAGLVVALLVLAFWCIAWPFAIFRVTSLFQHRSKMDQERVSLFTGSYDDRFHVRRTPRRPQPSPACTGRAHELTRTKAHPAPPHARPRRRTPTPRSATPRKPPPRAAR